MAANRKYLFVAVSTGQMVANFPPILQFARPDDVVLWLSSKKAHKERWADSAKEVLKGRGVESIELSVGDLNTPSEIASPDVLKYFHESGEKFSEVFFILNGGPKLTPLGLALVGEEIQQYFSVRYVYGDERCQFREYPSIGLDSSPFVQSYEKDKMLFLDEIVRVNGMRLGAPSMLWRDGQIILENRDFNSKDWRAFIQELDRKNQDPSSSSVDLGGWFECLVFHRVVSFLEKRPNYTSIIKEIVGHAKVFGPSNADALEYDVAIVLVNGIVLNFECKSGTNHKVKDLQSRILAQERSSSRLGKMFVVFPYFPGSSSFFKYNTLWRELQKFPFINLTPFTPQQYAHVGVRQPVFFEKNLDRILRFYLPDFQKV